MQSFIRVFKTGPTLLSDLVDEIGDDVYTEVMPHDSKPQIATNKLAIKLATQLDIKVIATNDAHYTRRKDTRAHDVLLAIKSKKTIFDKDRWTYGPGFHMRSYKEMKIALKNMGFYKREYLRNTLEIAEKCSDFIIPKYSVTLPRVKGVPIVPRNRHRFLMDLCKKGYKEKFGHSIVKNKEYYNRVKFEHDLITRKKFELYFLIIWDLLKWAREVGIFIGPGRGSVGGSLLAYLLGITSLDSVKWDLPFGRFINEERMDLPDIDIDFEHEKRHLIRKRLEQIYGEGKVAGVSSFNRMKAKAIIRDVGRVFKLPPGEIDQFAKLIDSKSDADDKIQEVIDNFEEGEEFAKNYPEPIKLAKAIQGQVRGYSQHAAALVLSDVPISNSGRCNLMRAKQEGELNVNWEKDDTEYVGFLKFDALSLKLLSTLSYARDLIKKNYGKTIDFDRLNLEDKAVLREISKGETVGLFQLNAYPTTTLIKEMGVEKFPHIFDAIALVRPGPTGSGMTAEYIRRKNEGAKWDAHPEYLAITKNTHGLLVYQEQVMEVIVRIGGQSYATADTVRKIIGKKRDPREFKKYKKAFVKGCLKIGVFDRTEANEFWAGLEKWASYGFNKAHSVAYALLGYWCAWLKKYYPTEFLCAALTHESDERKSDLVEEAYRRGLTIVLPKVNVSDPFKWTARENKLYVPFYQVKGLGPVKSITAATLDTGPGIKKFFTKGKATNQPTKHKGKLGELLDSFGAYSDKDDYQITNEVKALFDFRIVLNPRLNYPKLYELFNDKLRLDYLDAALAGDKKVLKKLRKPIKIKSFKGHKNLARCKECELIKQCDKPVPPSPGKYAIVISGEGPGWEEDRDGIGFVGRSGDLVWKYLKRHGWKREYFHVTNIEKCYPKETRRPTKKQIDTCSRLWFEKELKIVKPRVILAYGNANLYYFTGKNSGITNISGRIQWNEKHAAWIVYCLHPAATFHNSDNKPHFTAGMKSFVRIVKTLVPALRNK